MKRVWVAALVLIGLSVAAPPTHAVGGPPLSIDLAARSVQQGELVVLTIATGAGPSTVAVAVFGKHIPAFRIANDTWRALVGIDLDQKPGRYTATITAAAGGEVITASQPVIVRRKVFAVRTLRVDPSFVTPSPELLSRIAEETQFINGVYARSEGQRLWSGPFVRPVPQAVNSRFGSRSIFNGERRSAHGGADFLSPAATPILAPNAGRIVCARPLFFTGSTVMIDHGLGMFSLLAHLSRMDVQEGDVVAAGQVVGLVGATGRVTGPHLHWALSVSGARVDPMSALALLGARSPGVGIK